MDFEYIVIGCGIMGSAAAMHLAAASKEVALIGPSEAMADADDAIPKASHHDEGRITRMLDADIFWSHMARRSIKRYRQVEKASGIQFFNECGFLWIDNAPVRVEQIVQRAADDAVTLEQLAPEHIKEKFPYLSELGISAALYQPHNAGTINPRAYVRAMATCAQAAGARRFNDQVIHLNFTSEGVDLHTCANQTLRAAKILLTTGAYGAVERLIDQELSLSACRTGVVLVEVPRQAVDDELADMPSIISRTPPNRPNTYLLPPLKYPDGKFYLKIGIGEPGPLLNSADELNHWLRDGYDNDVAAELLDELSRIMPDLDLSGWKYMPCATCHTPDARPVVDLIGNGRVGLLLGGNGYAAKSGDALGELGAVMMHGGLWPGPIPRSDLSVARFNSDKVLS
ncbi:MAG: FAD-dependent oxidoreductase [Desulfobacterales bacterium]|jgi:sarcosine oxidase